MHGKSFEELVIGERGEFEKTISESDIYAFAGMSGDFSLVHINQRVAEMTRFGGRIAHGVLTLGLVSAAIGMSLPGTGTIWTGIDKLQFMLPVHPGDTIRAVVQVKELIPEKKKAILEAECYNQKNEIVLSCLCYVIPPKKMI